MKNEAAKNVESQEAYDKKKISNQAPKLSFEEKTELSWQFLDRITEMVVNKFSLEDKKIIKDAGRALVNNGAVYQHQVEAEVRTIYDKNRNTAIGQGQNGSRVVNI
ncbi:MAG: DUF2660 domain-containing protein [Janthinobacterium lividum]